VKDITTTVINTTKQKPIPKRRITELTNLIFTGEKKTGSVNVVLIGDKRMKTLNTRYRGTNRTTDVLSFSLDDDEGDQPPLAEFPIAGEIYISVPQAQKHAKSKKHSLSDEILFLVSHGLLHLVGYTHDTTRKFERMLDKQIRYLNRLYGKP